MRRRRELITFITALIPGVGYMYLGLARKGVQFLALYLLIEPLLNFIGLGFLSGIIKIPIWFYTFFDTYHLAHKIDRGESVSDVDFIFNKNSNGSPISGEFDFSNISNQIGKNGWMFIAWLLIIVGILALLNKFFYMTGIFHYIQWTLKSYFVPLLLVALGVFLLAKKN